MVNSSILREELRYRMTVVATEFERWARTDHNGTYQKVFATAFMWHNWLIPPLAMQRY